MRPGMGASPHSLTPKIKSIMKAITVRDLAIFCTKMILSGRGDKRILLTNDDEWNGYHELFEGFFTNMSEATCGGQMLPHGVSEANINDYVILG